MNAATTSDASARQAAAAARQPLAVQFLLAAGVIGPLLFLIVLLVEGATRPGYNAWHHPMSTLSLGPQGWMQVTNFLFCGALLVCFAAGLRRALHPGAGSTLGPILLALCGLGFIGAGIFATDPAGYPPGAPATQTLHGSIHLIVSNVSFLSVIVACFVLARRFAAIQGWRGWALYSIATAILAIVFTIVATLATSPDPGSLFGLFQRLTLLPVFGWIALVALRLMTAEVPTGR